MNQHTRQRNIGLVGGLQPPFKDPDVGVERERLCLIFQSDLRLDSQQFLVHVGMGLQLHQVVGWVFQLQLDATKRFVRDAERQHAEQFHVF